MKNFTIILLLALSSLAFAQDGSKSNPGSLLGGDASSPFADRVARKVGDLVTIIVNETSSSAFSANTSASKSDTSGIQANFFNDFLNRLIRPLTTSANSTVGGKGSTGQTGTMNARVTVMVKEVLPNGNLVLEGSRSLVTNRETQIMVVSGIVRPWDIRSDNTVLSAQVADAQIRMEGKGMIADRQRKGILTTVLDWLF